MFTLYCSTTAVLFQKNVNIFLELLTLMQYCAKIIRLESYFEVMQNEVNRIVE